MRTRAVRSYDSLPRSQDILFDLPLYSPLLGAGKALDRSRYRNNGAVVGAAWASPFRYFDGVDDYIGAGQNVTPAGAITMEAWVYPQEGGARPFLETQDHSNDGGYHLRHEYGQITVYLGINGITQGGRIGLVTENEWAHLAATWSDETGEIRVYKNSTPVGGWNNKHGAITYVNRNLHIGGRLTNTPWSYYKGLIGEARVYSRALSATECRLNYEATRWRYQ